MDLEYKEEDLRFREEVRQFFREHLPPELSEKVRTRRRIQREDAVRWHKILAKKGWIAPGWPVKYGGTGWSSMERHIWAEEYALAYAPPTLSFGLNLLAPVLLGFASEEQKQHYLPRIYHAEDWWCQGYSEPGAGSDLASLKTRAEREGDFYIVNGQKTWTTLGQHADWIFCLVRTSTEGAKQTGISFLLIDMKTPGISVRPIITLDETHEVNEVFFDNVKVPVANLIGEENKGWTYAKYLLGHERTGIAAIGAQAPGTAQASRWRAAAARPHFRRPRRRCRDRTHGAGNDRAEPGGRRRQSQDRPRSLPAQGQGHGNLAGHQRAAAGGRRPRRSGLRPRIPGRPQGPRRLRR
jgi:alkylation response protein AidB-like acyl-CoA dehydrogenase